MKDGFSGEAGEKEEESRRASMYSCISCHETAHNTRRQYMQRHVKASQTIKVKGSARLLLP